MISKRIINQHLPLTSKNRPADKHHTNKTSDENISKEFKGTVHQNKKDSLFTAVVLNHTILCVNASL